MKKKIIKICCLFMLLTFVSNAQNDIQAGIFTVSSDSTMLQVKAIPSSNITDKVFSGVNFTIRWLASYNVSLDTSNSSFGIEKNGSEQTSVSGTYKYQIFSAIPNVSVTWTAGVPVTLIAILVNQTGNGKGDFELAPSNFLPTSGEEWYIEIGGFDRTNPAFDPGSTVALLPVELTTFTASVKNNIVNLNWQTATEVNNFGFEIEKSPSQPSQREGVLDSPFGGKRRGLEKDWVC